MITYILNGSSFRTLALCIFLCSLTLVVKGQGEDLAISRSIEKTGERQYLVTVKVKKGDLKGYAKLEEMIPKSFVASKKETRSSNYIFNEGKVKFIWMELPSASEFKVVYKLIQKQSKFGEYTITGRLSCVSGEDLLRVRDTSSFEVKAPKALAQKGSGSGGASASGDKEKKEGDGGKGQKEENRGEENGAPSGEGENKGGDEKPAKNEKPEKNGSKDAGGKADEGGEGKEASEKGKGSSEKEGGSESENEKSGDKGDEKPSESGGDSGKESGEEPRKKVDNNEKAKGGTNKARYAVQIGAFGEEKSDAFLDERYDLKPRRIYSQREGGLYKYRVGKFSNRDEAEKMEKELRSQGLEGVFVVILKEGSGSAKDELASGEKAKKEGTDKEKEGTSTELPDEAYFSVQLGAFGEKKSDAYFEERYGVSGDEIHFYKEDGLYKYSTGNFVDYEQARKEKKRLRSQGLKGAFIVGFKGGDRVKVSALRE